MEDYELAIADFAGIIKPLIRDVIGYDESDLDSVCLNLAKRAIDKGQNPVKRCPTCNEAVTAQHTC